MFDDDDMTNEEIQEALARGDPPGLKRFGPDWRKEMDMHPLFMDDVPQEVIDGTLVREEWPVLASHLDMMYNDDDDIEGNASYYKEDGNVEYKKGTKEGYYKAIISYTEGLSQNCENKELNAQLYCNRAAAQFSIGNYRRATQDSAAALSLQPTYLKAITRGALSQQKLGNLNEVISWCDKGLAIEKRNKSFLELKIKTLQKLKEQERDARKEAAREKKERRQNAELLAALQQRNLNLYLPEDEDEGENDRNRRLLESLKCTSHGHVTLNEEGKLVWPVRLLYPEYATSDLISQFCEETSISDHLSYMFPPEGQSPEWDTDGEYTMDTICVAVDSAHTEEMNGRNKKQKKCIVKKDDSLLKILQDNNVLIAAGVPTFEVYLRNSDIYNEVFRGS